jgi:hypothetical protein
MHVYRVSQGSHTRWFTDSGEAKQYAKDRYDINLDGVPFVCELDHSELMVRLNTLEASHEDMQ